MDLVQLLLKTVLLALVQDALLTVSHLKVVWPAKVQFKTTPATCVLLGKPLATVNVLQLTVVEPTRSVTTTEFVCAFKVILSTTMYAT